MNREPGSYGGVGAGSGSSVGLSEGAAGALAYVFGFISGIVFLLAERRSRFVRFCAAQSIVLSAAWFCFWLAYSILFLVLGVLPGIRTVAFVLFAPVRLLVGLMFFLAWLVAVVRAWRGIPVRFPVLADLADRLAGRV